MCIVFGKPVDFYRVTFALHVWCRFRSIINLKIHNNYFVCDRAVVLTTVNMDPDMAYSIPS